MPQTMKHLKKVMMGMKKVENVIIFLIHQILNQNWNNKKKLNQLQKKMH